MDTVQAAKVLKALSHPNRLELYLQIVKSRESNFETGCCDCFCLVSDIMSSLKVGAPTISHHLKELSNAGLITTERRGKFLVANINEETVAAVNQLLTLPVRKE